MPVGREDDSLVQRRGLRFPRSGTVGRGEFRHLGLPIRRRIPWAWTQEIRLLQHARREAGTISPPSLDAARAAERSVSVTQVTDMIGLGPQNGR